MSSPLQAPTSVGPFLLPQAEIEVFLNIGLVYNKDSMSDSMNTPDKVTYFAETDYRSRRIKFGIRDDDRARHMYVIGKTGMGKSTLLENLAIQDIQNGEGICFIDPHGGTAETLLSYVPEHRIKDVIYFAPFDQEFPVGLNVMEDLGRDKRPLVVSGLMGAFKKVWVDAWSARMEYILNNAMLALMETPGSTLLGVNRMFADKDYRNMIVANVTDPSVRAFWVDEYAKYSDKFATEATAAIQNKVGQFAANPLIRNMVGQPKSTFDIRDVMDKRKILIVNLSKGRMGEGNANLVGSMLITKIYLAAMSRADVGPEQIKSLPPFYLYVDEFQSFANESFADILSEARKYKLALTIAHQYIEQMSDEVRAAVFGNVGTMIAFRVGSYDAEVLEKEFAPVFISEDIVNLGFAQVYLKLMIKGIGSPPFSATTINRPKLPAHTFAQEVIDSSRAQFALPRAQVEEEVRKWHEPVPPQPRDPNSSQAPETRKYPPGARPTASAAARPPSAQYVEMGRESAREYRGEGERTTPPRAGSETRGEGERTMQNRGTNDRGQGSNTETGRDTARPYSPPASAPLRSKEEVHQPFRNQFAELVKRVEEPTPAPSIAPASPLVTRSEEQISPITVASPVTQTQTPVAPLLERRHVSQETPPRVHLPAQAGGERTPHAEHPAPLSLLKTSPKRDKGPSEQNLSSLRDALSAVLVSKGVGKSVEQAQTSGQSREMKREFVPTPAPAPNGKEENLRTQSGTEGLPPAPPPPPQAQVRSPLLDSPFIPPPPTEVPEDVLKKVLAD